MQIVRATTLLLLLAAVPMGSAAGKDVKNIRGKRVVMQRRAAAAATPRVLQGDSYEDELASVMGAGDSSSGDTPGDAGIPSSYSHDEGGNVGDSTSGDEVMLPPSGGGGTAPSPTPPTGGGTPGLISVNVEIDYFAAMEAVMTDAPEAVQQAAEAGTFMPTEVAFSGATMTTAPTQLRRKLQETDEVTPTEEEIDTLIANTLNFYSQVYMDAFGNSLAEIDSTGVTTGNPDEDSIFRMELQFDLIFDDVATADEVDTVTEGVNQDEYVTDFVQPSGPYFEQTETVGIGSEANEGVLPTAAPTDAPTPSPTTMEPTVAATMEPTMEPTETAATPEPTMNPTETVVTDAPEETDPPLVTTGAPTAAEVPEVPEVPETEAPVVTDAPTAAEVPVVTDAPTEAEVLEVVTDAPTEAAVEETGAPTTAPVEGECQGTTARVVGIILMELDNDADLMEPTEDQIVELAQHVLQAFGLILRDSYGEAIRGFSATIDETNTSLDGNAYPLSFDATILFAPCAPPAGDVNDLFLNADYTVILSSFEPTGGSDENVFNELTGEAEYTGETTIYFPEEE